MSKPKRDTLKEAISQIMYCCSGDKEQYEDTINAVLGAVEVYVTQFTKTALEIIPQGASQPKIQKDNILYALSCDPRKQAFIQSMIEKQKPSSSTPSIPN